jgi:hypothetical protein
MSELIKAVRAIVPLGAIEIEGLMLPDAGYRMSQAQASEAVEEPPVYALRFLQSKDSKALLGEGYTDYTPETIEVQSAPGVRGQTRVNALPLEVVAAYWLYRAYRGNRKALLLCWALLSESLERRFDAAFGVTRAESEYNDVLTERRQLERDLTRLGEAYALDDDLRQRVEYLERFCRDRGFDPWSETQGGQE